MANLMTDESGNNLVHQGTKGPLIYGGLQGNLECLHLIGEPQKSTNNMELFCLIDTPLTGALETVGLPYLIYRDANRPSEQPTVTEKSPASQKESETQKK